MANEYRTHNCGELRISDVEKEVRLAGFVQKVRNLGKMKFIDLRDENGITQIVISESDELNEKCKNINTECSLTVSGKVVERSSKNSNMPTGDIEIVATDVKVLGKCKNELPFEINNGNSQNVREDLRLEYRFLDLRNENIHNNIKLRSKILKDFRNEMDALGFTEIQTPILANSSPEGARDFIVPSRLHPGEFYALPQAPQQFKQLLMVSGFEKYYQIAPCFRDEDPRADRSPGEFYQLDFEMSFVNQEDVFNVIETIVPNVFKKNTNWKVDEGKFIRIPYKEAMEKYGSDKPDLRNPLIIEDITQIFENTEFNAFKNKTIKAIAVSNMGDKPRKFFDMMSEYAVEELDAKGLAWVKVDEENNLTGGISKFIDDSQKEKLFNKLNLDKNFAVFFVADELEKAHQDIYNILLQVMDYAILSDNKGQKADFRHVVIIMTTNAGAQYAKQTIGFNNIIQSGDNMMKSVKSTFKPEFLNRLTSVTIFNDMNKEMAELILNKKLAILESQLLNKKIKLSISSSARDHLLQVGFSPIYGGREIDRVITSKVKPHIMRAILHGDLHENMTANIDFTEDRISLICSNDIEVK